ncbi:alpha/beta fold hydrolase [Streptosporangium carneum]|uniref:AB hydrolase-1 domain-containing protein n=1 Tax=Streptosporangium carneum TaxID=47481 RepID=A0A9W6I5Y9_9ACTN|nr:alpha/beta hydrolase [Streptosporangium carneum]GLK12722.1 hypothetical protein GCM10017600_61320 [Streptosporangium carneum]
MEETAREVVTGDGVRLVCRDGGGPGPAVVLLHGLAGASSEWRAVADLLGPEWRTVAVDQRGHGDSERRPADVSRAAHVADVVEVIGALRLGPVALVGQSLGGNTALLVAAAAPDLVRGLVLVEAGPGRPDPAAPGEIGGWLDSWPVPFPDRERAADFLGGGSVGRGWASGLVETDEGLWPRFDREVVVASLTAACERSYWDEWRRIRCPALVVLGERGIVGVGESDRMRDLRPDIPIAVVAGAGHDLHLEDPRALHERMAGFLRGL